jgi:PAS domain S-box-containing protein
MVDTADSAQLDQSILLEALKSISQGVLITGCDRCAIYVNQAFQEISGYADADVLGRTCRFLQGADTDPLTVAAIRIALDSGQAFAGEILNYKKSGAPCWNDLTVTPIRARNGGVTHFVGITRDVTARRSAETALVSAEQRYRLLFDHAQAGIVLHGHGTEVVYANAMASTILGVDQSLMVGALTTDPHWRFLREDGSLMPVDEYPVSRALGTRRVVASLVVGVRRPIDCHPVWVMCNAYPIFDDQGEVRHVIVSFVDVTELKQTERALQKSEERLRLVLRGANDAAWDWDLATNEHHFSPRWWQMLGYAENEIAGDAHLWKSLVHPEDLARASEIVEQALSSSRTDYEHEFRLRHKEGHYVPVLSRAFILRDYNQRPIRISGTNTDITERNRVNNALRQSEARLRAFVEASPFPTMLSDESGNLRYFNPACVRTFGYQLAEVPNLGTWRARAYPDPRYRRWVTTTWNRRLSRSVQAGRPFEPFEIVVRCKDGTDRTVLASAIGLTGDAAGTRLNVLLDVTEQRRLERGIIEAASREQRRLGMDLHDGLGQELTGLSLSLTGLSRRVRNGSYAGIEEELDSLASLAGHCIATTRAIAHGLSPVEPGCDGLERALLRLSGRGSIGAMKVKINLSGFAHRDLEQAVGDAIYRIVQEALTNAARHSGATQALIEAHCLGSTMNVAVSDNGCGLSATARTQGLGLNIMRYRAHAIGGHMDIESPETGGTIVKCRFPIPGGGMTPCIGST